MLRFPDPLCIVAATLQRKERRRLACDSEEGRTLRSLATAEGALLCKERRRLACETPGRVNAAQLATAEGALQRKERWRPRLRRLCRRW